jgi:hypothetical protein
MGRLKNELVLSLMRERIKREIVLSTKMSREELNRLVDRIMDHIVQAANRID